MKGLVVESSNTYRSLLATLLRDVGCEVDESDGGEQALKYSLLNDYDLVCVGQQLNDMDGFLFGRRFRAHDKTRSVPLIMISAEPCEQAQAKAQKVGVTELFQKGRTDEIQAYVSSLYLENERHAAVEGRVLHIDDDDESAARVKAVLELMSLTVDRFANADEALKFFENESCDLVMISACLAGEMSGDGLIWAIRNREDEKKEVPILAVPTDEDIESKVMMLNAGADDFVPVPIVDKELQVRVGNLVTIKKLKDKITRQRQRLETLAMRDQLTGLYNRHFLMETAPKKMSEAIRHSLSLSLVVMDVDHFKRINECEGQAVGDVVLTEIGALLKEQVRAEDLAVRFGGQEFVLLMSHCNERGAVAKAERLRAALEALQPQGLWVTASFGVAQLNHDKGGDFSRLFTEADKAVYCAKEAGRNKVMAASAARAGL